jgi:hypothetical protein
MAPTAQETVALVKMKIIVLFGVAIPGIEFYPLPVSFGFITARDKLFIH